MRLTRPFAIFAFAIALLCGTSAAVAATSIALRVEPFLTGLAQPVFITSAKDGTGRLFIVHQRGRISVVEPGSTTPTTFLDISSKVSQTGSERGLLGLAFHPDFGDNGYFFVNYTRTNPDTTTTTVIARFKAAAGNASASSASERVVMTVAQPFSNHNGGMIEFGPDGFLYIGLGDGGSANDPLANAQNINTLLGKMLRIVPDVSGDDANPAYTVPSDNPFVGVSGADEIFALGLRNPWRWSFDRGGTNQLWAGDVGQNAVEEVDVITLGGNYGWRVYEGTGCTNIDPSLCTSTNYAAPVFQYSRTSPRCAVTGGYAYRGKRRTLPDGAFVYADYCSGEIMMWYAGTQRVLIDTARLISSFGEDDRGELLVVGLGSTTSATGTVERLVRPTRTRTRDAETAEGMRSEPRRERVLKGDFDGDGFDDAPLFDAGSGEWSWLRSSDGGASVIRFGGAGDFPVPSDYDGDGREDLAVFRPSTATWFVLRSSDGAFISVIFGRRGDVPLPADHDGDGVSDIAVHRPSDGYLYVIRSSDGRTLRTTSPMRGPSRRSL
jgi:glucose/arabinose dehydrogenase